MPTFHKDALGGLILISIGLFTCGYSYTQLQLGSSLRMGPGYFPFVLGLVLAVLGSVIAVLGSARSDAGFRNAPWRAITMIVASPLCFALVAEGLGLLPATAIASFVATLASPEISNARRAAVVVILTGLCMLVFYIALKVSAPLFGTWIS